LYRYTEVLLVLDGTTGLNMLNQAREFNAAVGVTVREWGGAGVLGRGCSVPFVLSFVDTHALLSENDD
jgi:hypothetical protein